MAFALRQNFGNDLFPFDQKIKIREWSELKLIKPHKFWDFLSLGYRANLYLQKW